MVGTSATSVAFERNMHAQARQALGDTQAFCGGVLRIVQQVNHTDFWPQTLGRMVSTLSASGPVSAKQIWGEVQQGLQDPQNKAALQSAGLTDDVAAAITDVISKLDANLLLRGGKVSVETQVAGASQPLRFSLKAPGGPATSITDLLRRTQFDQVVSAFSNNDPVYLEAVASAVAVDYEPADLFAIGAVAARQGMAEHVRKLEDTGLATYQGNDPATLLTLLVVGLFLAAVGATIEYLCDHPGQVMQPKWVCDAGEVLLFLSLLALAGPVVAGNYFAWVAFGLVLADWIAHLPGFQPTSGPG
jgi:hypothetical protein